MDFDRYVAPPGEPRSRPPLASLRPLLALAVVLLLLGAIFAAGLVTAREDPSLTVPDGTEGIGGDAPLVVPTASE